MEKENIKETQIKINDIYLNDSTLEEAQTFFETEAFIQFNDFLENKNINKLKNKLENAPSKLLYNPMKYKKFQIEFEKIYDLELIKLMEFFRSKDFLEYIEKIVGFNINYKSINISKYSHKDFTLIHDDFQEKEDVVDVIFDLSDSLSENMGGILTYATKEEEIFYLESGFNSLSILYKPETVVSYLKYINNLSKGKKILRFELQFEISEDF